MSVGNRLLALVIVGSLLLLAAPWLLAWVVPMGLRVQDLPDLGQVLQQESERGARLDAERGPALRRIAALDRIVEDLIEGRLTLAEAGRRVRAGHDDDAGFWVVVRQADQGASEEELLYRHLIHLAGDSLAEEPERGRVVRLRLEAELRAWLARAKR